MQTVTLALDGTKEPDKTYFKLLLLAARARGGEPNQKLSKADRRLDSAVKQALYAISHAVETKAPDGSIVPTPEAGAPDSRDRHINAEAVTLTLPGPEFERLRAFFDNEHMVWGLDHADFAEDLSQKLSAAHAAAQ